MTKERLISASFHDTIDDPSSPSKKMGQEAKTGENLIVSIDYERGVVVLTAATKGEPRQLPEVEVPFANCRSWRTMNPGALVAKK